MGKSDFTLPTLDDLFSTQAERDDAKTLIAIQVLSFYHNSESVEIESFPG